MAEPVPAADLVRVGNELATALRYMYQLRGWPGGDDLVARWDALVFSIEVDANDARLFAALEAENGRP